MVGSDAHAQGSFAARLDRSYAHIAAAGFEALTFRRGDERVRIEVPQQASIGAADSLHT